MLDEQKRFSAAVKVCVTTFNQTKHKRKLRDLSPRFWVALMDLELACSGDDWDQLKLDFQAAYRYLGAPGDFGYGTPCGDSLRDVYDSWNALCAAKNPKFTPPPCTPSPTT